MGKSVLLFSGGTDSFVLSKLLKPDIHLYFNIGTAEVRKELKACKRLGIEPIVDSRLFLGDQELPNKIVPMRNLFFILMACYYGDIIYLGATKGDMTRDCDEGFRLVLNAMLMNLYTIPEKNPRGNHLPQVLFPVKRQTKTEILRDYLAKGFSVEELRMTRSCYKADNLKDCGHCISCFRKWISYVNNGIYHKRDFIYNPLDKVEEFRPIVEKLDGESEDLLTALMKVGYKHG